MPSVNGPTRLLRVALLSLATLGCAGQVRAGDEAPDRTGTWARLLRMTDSTVLDTSLVRQALASGDAPLRRAATLAVGQVRGAAMAPLLRELLADRDTGVAANAAFALGMLRDTASVAALAGALRGPSSAGLEAAWALGQIGEPSRAVLEGAIAAPHAAPVAREVLVAAGRLRPVPVTLIASRLADADTSIARAAAYALGRSRAPAGVRALIAHAASPDVRTREYVARGIARGAAGDSLAAAAFAALVRLARDPHPHVRISAARSLGGYGADAEPTIRALAGDADPNVRIAAAGVAALPLGRDSASWRALWGADSSLAFRRALLAAAVEAGVAIETLQQGGPDWARSGDWRQRAALAEAAGASPSAERARALVGPLLADSDGRVRGAALGALSAFASRPPADSLPWLRPLLLAALDDPDVVVRATALSALARAPRATEVGTVVRQYARRAALDTINDAGIASVAYIVAAWRRDSAAFDAATRATIERLAPPSDALVRDLGDGVTPFAHWWASGAPVRPLAWYAAQVRELVNPALGGRLPRAVIETGRGSIELELFALDAPLTVANFLVLARRGYFDGFRFHRVVPGFVAQDGDPRGDGNGGPGYAIRDELNRRRYDRGAVGMALSGPNTGGSQWFITLAPQPHLDGGYTVFARVVGGMAAADALVQGDRIVRIRPR